MPRGRGSRNRRSHVAPEIERLLERFNFAGFSSLPGPSQDALVRWFEENDARADREKVARHGSVLDGTERLMRIARTIGPSSESLPKRSGTR